MLLKRDFKKIAEIVKDRVYEYENIDCINPFLLAVDLADYLETKNPKFDRKKFLEACGL